MSDLDLITNNYKYEKIKLDDGDYLDIKIFLPIPDENKSENSEKYLKAYLAEAVETVNSYENKKHADIRIKALYNFKNITTIFVPLVFYLTIIVYRRFSKDVSVTKSFKENFRYRFKAFGFAAMFFLLSSRFRLMYENILDEGRKDYLKEILDSQENSVLEDYEKFRENYNKAIQEMNNKKLI
jgi:hypothetical protein